MAPTCKPGMAMEKTLSFSHHLPHSTPLVLQPGEETSCHKHECSRGHRAADIEPRTWPFSRSQNSTERLRDAAPGTALRDPSGSNAMRLFCAKTAVPSHPTHSEKKEGGTRKCLLLGCCVLDHKITKARDLCHKKRVAATPLAWL